MQELKIAGKVQGLAPWLRIVREAGPTPYNKAPRQALIGPRSTYDACKDLQALETESFVVICLDIHHKIIARSEISRGILNSTIVHPREVFRLAVVLGAASVVLVHNHPSGDTTPSNDDKFITDQLVAAGKVLGIPVIDHVVIGNGYASFAELGFL